MGYFQGLNENNSVILDKIISNDNLCKLLKYTDKDPLTQPVMDKPIELIYNNIYPYLYIPNVDNEAKSFITFNFRKIEKEDEKSIYIRISDIVFNVICHQSLQMISEGSRVYAIMDELDKVFNNQYIKGIGKLRFDGSDMTMANDLFTGYYLRYKNSNFSM